MSILHNETFTFSSYEGIECPYYTHTPTWPSPFPSCRLTGCSRQPNKLSLEWSNIQSRMYIAEGNLKIVTSSGTTVFDLDFALGAFPPSSSGSVWYKQSAGHFWDRPCTMTMSFVLFDPLATKKEDYAETFAASMVSRIPNDVCIHFPRTGQSLWSNETTLKKASPYLSSLLSSGFSEAKPTSKDDGPTADDAMIDPFEFEDSDEESDQMPLSESTSHASDFGVAKFKRIDITQATYTTYANVLCWIGSGYIAFPPLKSTKRFPSTPSSPKPRQSPSSLPTPASPKFVYRLAHLLELPDLVNLALGNFRKQLTSQNVAYELYTDVASTYPQIRDIAMNYAVEHWKEVVKSKVYEEVRKRAETEGIDGLTGILLSEKLAAR